MKYKFLIAIAGVTLLTTLAELEIEKPISEKNRSPSIYQDSESQERLIDCQNRYNLKQDYLI